MTLVLTNIYLDEIQRKHLERLAEDNHSDLSLEVRNVLDLHNSELATDEMDLLDASSRQAKSDIEIMNTTLDAGLYRAQKFFRISRKFKMSVITEVLDRLSGSPTCATDGIVPVKKQFMMVRVQVRYIHSAFHFY